MFDAEAEIIWSSEDDESGRLSDILSTREIPIQRCFAETGSVRRGSLDGGRIIERGSHDELIAAGGRYAALHALQTRDGAVAEVPVEGPAEVAK